MIPLCARSPFTKRGRSPASGVFSLILQYRSVPNLYALPSPQNERPNTFWTGSKEFYPIRVGHDISELKGGYLYDVTKPGNSNHGHLFKDGPRGNGVIGPALTPTIAGRSLSI